MGKINRQFPDSRIAVRQAVDFQATNPINCLESVANNPAWFSWFSWLG
jgi:hypothetical protein